MTAHRHLQLLRRVIGVALVALFALAGASVATNEAFGEKGEFFRVRSGTYASIFGDKGPSPGTAPDSVVMALEITQADGSFKRHLVPGTDGNETEINPSITYDAGQVFLLWASRVSERRSLMNVVGFDGQTWTETIEVSGDPVPFKGPPRVAITRDAYGNADDPMQRTILHLVWWESRSGAIIVFYSPIVLLEGEYIGWNPVVALNQFEALTPDDATLVADHRYLPLYKAATVEQGTNGRSVVVALPQYERQRLQSLRMHVLPAALNVLADDVRSHIIGAGRRGHRASILSFADEIRSHIIGAGVTLHGGVLQYVAEQVYIELLNFGAAYDPEDVQELAEKAWLTVLESGGSILGSGTEASAHPCQLLHVADSDAVRSEHQVEICMLSDRPVPETGPGPHTLHVSESGRQAMVVWKEDDGNLAVIQSEGDGWRAPLSLKLGRSLTYERALRVLREQIRDR